VNTECCADFAAAQSSLEHGENISPLLRFIGDTQIAFG
jgi:hypothetical protein